MGETILIYDERYESGPRFIGSFRNVPEDWTAKETLVRYGIGEHLCVYRDTFVPKNCIHHGKRFRSD
jgi:hypothetical protein